MRGKELIDISNKLQLPKIQPATAEKYLNRLKVFYDWLVGQGLIKSNPFNGLKPKKRNKKTINERKAYTEQHINMILSKNDFNEKNIEYRWWIILIAIEMGLRQNEISQLYKDDVVKEDGIWCIKIQEKREDQRIKNIFSERTVPIPNSLLKLGILKYINSKSSRIFPELKYYEDDGYAKLFSKWFSYNKKKWGFNEGYTFHSFRHYFVNKLKQSQIEESIVSEIVGHEHVSHTYGRYGKEYSIKKLKKIIDNNSSISIKKILTKRKINKLRTMIRFGL
ncbi:site-specific integrase [Photobacterium lutimaris]|uniref:Tyr recombinase domain-containing protein n=1 Tax=Photobacterium lutimaris TaxID=388278 RepID=A0A2T3IIA2_9GAMM|nr:site-specific integrase [Photobacterium lutimaris]PSU28075.1 hypothetical protein C9I99_26420 [Photobacterium lutimaris]